jgi:hypothetical protein
MKEKKQSPKKLGNAKYVSLSMFAQSLRGKSFTKD